jgi:hypothetical protein
MMNNLIKKSEFELGLSATKALSPFRPIVKAIGLPENEVSDFGVAAGMAVPVLGGIAGSMAGNGALSGVARSIGTSSGAGLGYIGSELLNKYLSDSKFFDSLDKNYRNIAKLTVNGLGTLAGGWGGYNLTKKMI